MSQTRAVIDSNRISWFLSPDVIPAQPTGMAEVEKLQEQVSARREFSVTGYWPLTCVTGTLPGFALTLIEEKGTVNLPAFCVLRGH